MYSTVAELRSKLKIIITTIQDDAHVTANILEADLEIKTDLSGYIDFTLVPANSSDALFPIFLNQLSKYKTCELSLVYSYSLKRETTQVDDVTYWKNKYDELIQYIKDGSIPLELTDGTSIAGTVPSSQTYTDPKNGVKPFFGTDEYGEFETNDEKKDNSDRG
jgi:hypothetical protein